MAATRLIKNSHFNVASKLARGYEQNRLNNIRTNGLAAGVTVSLLSAAPVDLGKIYSAASLPTATRITGGTPYSIFGVAWGVAATTFQNGGTSGNFGNGTSGVTWRIKVKVDSPSICFAVYQSSSPTGYRVAVEKKYVSTTPIVATNSGYNNFIRVNLPQRAAGAPTPEVWLEGDGSSSISAIYVSPNGSIQPAPAGLQATVLGDSITVGYINTGTLGLLPAINDNFATVWADAFGITDVKSSGMSGEGFVQTGTGPLTFAQRIPFDVNGTEDVILIDMNTNDIGVTQSLVAPAVLAGLQAVRAKNPTALVILGGISPNGANSLAAAQTCEANYLSGFNMWADPNALFAPYASPPSGQPEIYGSGNAGSPCSGTLTFTAALTAATSATLTAAFAGPTNTYFLNFSDGSQKVVTLTNNSTAVSWTGAVTATATTTYYNGTTSGNADVLLGYDSIHPSGAFAHAVRGFWHADAHYGLLKSVS